MDTLGIRKGLLLIEVYVHWRIQGRGPGGPTPPPYFWTKLRPEEPKNVWGGGTGPPLSQGLDYSPRLLSEGLDLLVVYVAGTMIKCPPTAGFTVIFNNNNSIYWFVLRKYQPGKKKIHLRITLTQPNRKILVHNNSNSKNSKNNN